MKKKRERIKRIEKVSKPKHWSKEFTPNHKPNNNDNE